MSAVAEDQRGLRHKEIYAVWGHTRTLCEDRWSLLRGHGYQAQASAPRSEWAPPGHCPGLLPRSRPLIPWPRSVTLHRPGVPYEGAWGDKWFRFSTGFGLGSLCLYMMRYRGEGTQV